MSVPVRWLVIGSGGAGKSTLAKRMGERTGLPVVHLDSHYWNSGWVETPTEEWERTVDELCAEPEWIMDGNYGGTMARRIEAADAIVFLDLPTHVCLRRAIGRWLHHRGTNRDSLPEGCPERMGWSFARWILTYRKTRRPEVLERLEAVRNDRLVVVLRDASEVDAFVARLGE